MTNPKVRRVHLDRSGGYRIDAIYGEHALVPWEEWDRIQSALLDCDSLVSLILHRRSEFDNPETRRELENLYLECRRMRKEHTDDQSD